MPAVAAYVPDAPNPAAFSASPRVARPNSSRDGLGACLAHRTSHKREAGEMAVDARSRIDVHRADHIEHPPTWCRNPTEAASLWKV
jgi:hypothetical protein